MDPTEDLSARVLLKNILITEPPRSPITRSASKIQNISETRRSTRLSRKDAGPQTPQDILRRSLKHKMRESISRKSLPATSRRTTLLRKTATPASTSMMFDDGDTPRHILKNILLTEPVKSPVVHEEATSEEPQLPSPNSSVTSKCPSIEFSRLSLPDITISEAVSTAKGLSRKRPRRSLNITAFEKRLKGANDVEEEDEESVDEHSLSLSSSSSLSLKTPFVDVRSEKRGLQRRVPSRRKITEEEFGIAVIKRQTGGAHGGTSSLASVIHSHRDTAYSEDFTLQLSQISEPDVTTDIVNCNTALYTHSDAMNLNLSSATQDKPTLMASQLQRQITDMEQKEAVEGQIEGGMTTADDQPDDAAMMSKSEEDEIQLHGGIDTVEPNEEENGLDSQTDEDVAADPETEGDAASRSQSEQEQEVVPDSQTDDVEENDDEEEGGVDSHPEEDVGANSDSEEEEVSPDSQTEEEQEAAAKSQTGESAVDSQSEVDVEAGSQFEDRDVSMSETQDEHDENQQQQNEGEEDEQTSDQLEHDKEHISRRAQLSEGGLIIPITEAERDLADVSGPGWSDGKSKTNNVDDLHLSLTEGLRGGSFTVEVEETDDDKENSFHPEMTHDMVDDGHLSDAAAQEPAEQEEDEEEENEEDEEDEGFPCKTPAFIKEKANFFKTDHLASPTVLKNTKASAANEALPEAKSKQVPQKKRQRRPAQKEASLPKNYVMGVFKHFAKTKVSADVYPVLKQIMDKFFDRMVDDLETYADHAKRKTIEVEDAKLLLQRQGHVNDKVPVEVLIEKYLRMEQRKLLIPIATSGNIVFPKKRR